MTCGCTPTADRLSHISESGPPFGVTSSFFERVSLLRLAGRRSPLVQPRCLVQWRSWAVHLRHLSASHRFASFRRSGLLLSLIL
jgi:hypothetical protein